MKLTLKAIMYTVVQLIAVPLYCYGQYFQKLYDIDSSYDWGVNIFVKPNGGYHIFGTNLNPVTSRWELFNIQISSDGDTILNSKRINDDNASLYMGLPSEIKKLDDGYLSPVSKRESIDTYNRGWAGLIKYNYNGDTVFKKLYTDTSLYFEGIASCAVTANGNYLAGGFRGYNTPLLYPALLIYTDTLGDTIWTRTYQKNIAHSAVINNLIPLPDGRIIAAATSSYNAYISGWGFIEHQTPWFMVLDSSGNILKDTLYGTQYMHGAWGRVGELYSDMNGGYPYRDL